ncbi:hypothetical protein CVT26_011278 [Gymnopilus dilepis]|uniref:HMG box domain-containing protein n=1 Tax=Gymnopilus dilepis TaxID=231916 RepID=A0A409VJE8_9AGAR|nr:hypothetical protein CVT26_011278 [Gymnopilus dilepis]
MAPTRNTSHPPEKDPDHIPRPPNCFILYRAQKLQQLRREASKVPGSSRRDTRKLISKMWQEEPEEVVEYWKQVAEQRAAEHQKAHPNYKYRPKRRQRPSAAPQTFEVPPEIVLQQPDIPLLPVPALVPSSVPAVETEGAPSPPDPATESHSGEGQTFTIISPSFIRPSPNFSFLSLDDPSELGSMPPTPALSPMPQISLPVVPSIPAPMSMNPYPTLPAGPTMMGPSESLESRHSTTSQSPFTQSHYYGQGANSQDRLPTFASAQREPDFELATPPLVPSQGVTSWPSDPNLTATRSSLLNPATSALGHAATDSRLLNMVSNLILLPENALSNLYF